MKTLVSIVLTLGLMTGAAFAQGTRVNVTISAQDKNPAFDAAVNEYRQIWTDEGRRIVDAMEKICRLKFPDKNVKVEIYEGPSFSGRGGAPMKLRASYGPDEKKGTVVHELGHRMNAQLEMRPPELDEHRLLFLYLYDLYVDLYGKEFADKQVAFGRTLKGMYDYDAAWTWALGMTSEERARRFADVLKINRK
jgi:hypothetical protein